jgi:hypothetical protein
VLFYSVVLHGQLGANSDKIPEGGPPLLIFSISLVLGYVIMVDFRRTAQSFFVSF